ncbi:polysaccharide lyase beta-sandwich domain-containing protein [Streptomyces sp. NBC_01808]|uniref:polysaccharide lyase family 8 super-sandwich domain-containing protein n=1 Tax=Streptomyces sp. NBC_01808 TaxID=2975947 RepID=UPI002DD9986B|nr:polysaccharide lyase family 8 super-sandwich domain-containing protein [Streptomyces sp. NBC_01808]WSA36044.1 polysaccharide lyase beta-sandwich domain-containing protein [Streptomyces sp. NBC_01808]
MPENGAAPLLDRRRVLLGGLGLAAGVAGLTLSAPALARAAEAGENRAAADDIQLIIERIQQRFLAQGDQIKLANFIFLARTSEALTYVESLRADGSWPNVDYADTTSSANGRVWSPYHALYRMMAMAHAYRDPDAPGYGKPEIIEALNRALLYWDGVKPTSTNWWEVEIGKSMAMGRVSIFVGDELSAEAREVTYAHNTGRLDPVGANGSWRTENYLYEAVAKRSTADIEQGYDTMAQTIAVDGSGGIKEAVQVDSSFWAHGAQLYSEGYGMALFTIVAAWADVSRGTSFALSDKEVDAIAFYILDGTRWLIRGEIGMMYLGYRPANTIDGVTSYAADFLEPLDRMVRADEGNSAAYKKLADNIRGKTRENGVTGHKYFWRSEFSSHLRAGYGIFTRINSPRMVGSEYRSTFRPEVGNEIDWNAQGATSIQVTNREYDDLVPAFDWFHYPGVTAPYAKVMSTSGKRNAGSFTGGVSDGRYGADVFTLDRSSTTGRKSYFYFDDEMVALGAGISSTSEHAVHTTVNQGAARANATVGGKAVRPGTDSAATGASWAYNDEIGYVFPEGGPLKVSNKEQSGSWIDRDPVTRNAFTLYFDHGQAPEGAEYAYIVLPGASPAKVRSYAAGPAVRILRNDEQVQAVRHPWLGLTIATFHAAGSLDLGSRRTLRVDQPAIVLLKESGSSAVVSVANPDQPGLTVSVTLAAPGRTRGAGFELGSGANLGKTVTQPLR